MATVLPILPRPHRAPSSPAAALLRAPASFFSRASLLLAVYIILLYRSNAKTPEVAHSIKLNWEKGQLIQIVTFTHHTLLSYVMKKGARIMLVLMAPLLYAGQQAVSNPIGQRLINNLLDSQVNVLGEKTKQLLGDPYMPSVLLSIVHESVDALLPDAKRLVQNKTNELIRYQRTPSSLLSSGSIVIVGGTSSLRQESTGLSSFLPSPLADSITMAVNLVPSRESLGGLVPTVVTDTATRFLPPLGLPSQVVNAASTVAGFVPSSVTDTFSTVTSYVPSLWPFSFPSSVDNKDVLLDTLDRVAREEDQENIPNLGWADQLRASILFTCAPCDKSVWQCTRDPVWVALTLLGLAPFGVGTAWWMILFVLHDKQDEFQLCNFIVGFMFSKFLGSIALLIYGAMLYYLCATRDVPTCQDEGPRVSELYDGILFFSQVFVVWLSYLLLPLSKECKAVWDTADAYLVEDWDKLHSRDRPKGGRLMALYPYYLMCVMLVLALAWIARDAVGQTDWKLRATLYWLKVLFGLLALPFVAFKIPFINTLLMQVRATGYTPLGQVVLHVRAKQAPQESEVSAEKDLRAASESLLSKVHEVEPGA